MFVLPLILGLGCSSEDPPIPEVLGIFETSCVGIWPADDCTEGCVDTAAETAWSDGWATFYQEEGNLTDMEFDEHVRIRNIEAPDAGTSAEIHYNLDIDWIRIVGASSAEVAEADPDEAEIAEAWAAQNTVLDVDVSIWLVSYEDVQAWFDECAASLGVVFPPQCWCDVSIATGSGTIIYEFSTENDAGGTAVARYDVAGVETPTCEVSSSDR